MFRVNDLTVQNSQQIQLTIHGSSKVRISNVQVHAPETSPNTDGIHITHSTDVIVQDCQIGTGTWIDDISASFRCGRHHRRIAVAP